VSWAQSRNSLLLTVDVKDVHQTADMFVYSDKSIEFRSVGITQCLSVCVAVQSDI